MGLDWAISRGPFQSTTPGTNKMTDLVLQGKQKKKLKTRIPLCSPMTDAKFLTETKLEPLPQTS